MINDNNNIEKAADVGYVQDNNDTLANQAARVSTGKVGVDTGGSQTNVVATNARMSVNEAIAKGKEKAKMTANNISQKKKAVDNERQRVAQEVNQNFEELRSKKEDDALDIFTKVLNGRNKLSTDQKISQANHLNFLRGLKHDKNQQDYKREVQARRNLNASQKQVLNARQGMRQAIQDEIQDLEWEMKEAEKQRNWAEKNRLAEQLYSYQQKMDALDDQNKALIISAGTSAAKAGFAYYKSGQEEDRSLAGAIDSGNVAAHNQTYGTKFTKEDLQGAKNIDDVQKNYNTRTGGQ